jgi:hypothetical protein
MKHIKRFALNEDTNEALMTIDSGSEPTILKFVNSKITSGTWEKESGKNGMVQILLMSGKVYASFFGPASDLNSLPMMGTFKIEMNSSAGQSFAGHTLHLYK